MGLNIRLGIAKNESNGHRKGKAENIELVETMRSLQREVLSYIVDNERIIRAQLLCRHGRNACPLVWYWMQVFTMQVLSKPSKPSLIPSNP
jgi:hypothetical protein